MDDPTQGGEQVIADHGDPKTGLYSRVQWNLVLCVSDTGAEGSPLTYGILPGRQLRRIRRMKNK